MTYDLVPFGSRFYFLFLALLVVARGADFLSTWLATPHLVLEANPIARRLGWRWGVVVNLAVCIVCARWPLPAVVIATTSFLVAARNFHSAWLMRAMGESQYRAWLTDRLRQSKRGVFVFCVLAQSALTGAVGTVLICFSQWHLVPLGVGAGMLTYAFAVSFFSLLSVWRIWPKLG